MKISFKYIILLVILALSCIFSYQAHWLLGVYRTQKEEMELHVTDAMISADIAEMMLRVKRMEADSAQAGAIEVGSGLLGDHRSYTKVNTFYQHRDSVLYNSRKTIYSSKQTVIVDNKKRKNKDTMVINEADTTPLRPTSGRCNWNSRERVSATWPRASSKPCTRVWTISRK